MKKKQTNVVLPIIIWVVICLLVGWISSAFTTPEITTWYANLIKPSFNPPNWIFAPVWSALYVLMGIAVGIIWAKQRNDKNASVAVGWFIVQLALNFAWSYIFFATHQLWWAFAEIIVLWLVLLLVIFKFNKISKPAAAMLIPYILWVTFASILNVSVAILN